MSALVAEDTITHGQIWAIAARAAEQKNADLLARCANALRCAHGSRRYKFGIRACVVVNVLLTQVAEQQEHEQERGDRARRRQAACAQRRIDRRAKVGAP